MSSEDTTVHRVLVTGSGGFIGRAVCADLARAGVDVVGLDRVGRVDALSGGDLSVTTVAGDLLDLSSLMRRFEEWHPRVVIHTAAVSHPGVSLELPLATAQANCIGTATLLEACRMAGIRRFVFLSSEVVYGNQPGIHVDEDAPLLPRTPYAASKVYGEALSRVYAERWGIEQTSIRLTHIYGPGNLMPDPVGDLLTQALLHGAVTADDRHHQNRLLYVDDAAKAIRALAAAESWSSPVYNIGPLETVSNESLCHLIADLLDCRVDIPAREETYGRDELGVLVTDRARSDFGFEPLVPLRLGLDRYAAWLRRQRTVSASN
jgi:UDP-glucose 4-epimerase